MKSTVLGISPLNMAAETASAISYATTTTRGAYEDGRFEPVLRLPNGDTVARALRAYELAVAGEPLYQFSLHIAGITIPGPCYIFGRVGANGVHEDCGTQIEAIRDFASPIFTGQRPRPTNDYLFGYSIDYDDGDKRRRIITERASGITVEESMYPFPSFRSSGRDGIHTYVALKGFDPNATVGYDEGMDTYFFQSGLMDKDGEAPLIWLGRKFREFRSVNEALFAARLYGAYLLDYDWRP
jgi:hypothetical protein